MAGGPALRVPSASLTLAAEGWLHANELVSGRRRHIWVDGLLWVFLLYIFTLPFLVDAVTGLPENRKSTGSSTGRVSEYFTRRFTVRTRTCGPIPAPVLRFPTGVHDKCRP